MELNKTIQTKEIRDYVESCLNLKLNVVSRKRSYVYARAIYFKLCREQTKLSLADIAGTVNMDHASALHAINNVFPSIVFYDKYLKDVYDDFRLDNIHKNENIYENYARLLRENTTLKNDLNSIKEDGGLEKRFIKLINKIPESKKEDVYIKLGAIVNIISLAHERETV
tara:strand:+ start:561 stop:1067 length:507 start_codon:yes stop_codon:yes gene_type:complete